MWKRIYAKGKKITAVYLTFFSLTAFISGLCMAGDNEGTFLSFDEMKELSFEELMDIEVVSASKRPEKLSETAAAIYVITGDDIRRAGVSTIPDALRLAPGVHVARVNTHWWAISIRGFNEELYSNKLLVLIDGRSVYHPIYSGVFWDVQDTLIEDIERIEVIRGPGSAIWGANAVNGVINIITKSAANTAGWFFETDYGDFSRLNLGSVRYGGEIDDHAFYRIFVKYFSREAMDESAADKGPQHDNQPMSVYSEDLRIDNWVGYRGGFRIDWTPGDHNTGMLQGEGYFNQDFMETTFGDETVDETSNIKGAFILGSWEHVFDNKREAALQAYYDYTGRDSQQAKYDIHVADFDFRYLFRLTSGHEVSLGLGYRHTHDNLDNFYMMRFDPEKYDQNLFSAFIQDSAYFYNDKLRLIAGSKFEHNDYTGFEYQPTCRMVWTPKIHYSIWAAVSRAVRTPARYERDGKVFTKVDFGEYMEGAGAPGHPPDLMTIIYQEVPNDDFQSETVYAWEGGLRLQPADFVWADISVFYNDYDNLKQLIDLNDQDVPDADNNAGWADFPWEEGQEEVLFLNHYPANAMEGESYGFEISMDIKAFDRWRIKPSYSWLKIDLTALREEDEEDSENGGDKDNDDAYDYRNAYKIENGAPRHMFSLLSEFDITRNIDFDAGLRFVDSIELLGTEDSYWRKIDSYLVFDLRAAWRPVEGLELSIIGRDLGHSHSELSELEVCPSITGKVTWRF